jgi:Caspase domain
MFRPVLRHALVAAAVLLGSHVASAENRVALVIGQSAYRAVVPLPNPANDVKAMAQLLGEAGFEVVTAADLSQDDLRRTVGEFAGKIAGKGPDTTALVFYAGHGIQVDGENYLIPVDVDPKRETDIPLQAVRLNDLLNTLTSVPSKMRIILLDACRNNPFPEINKSAGHGLAIVDAKVGAPGIFLSYSTSPGAEAEDGGGANSPYTTALLTAARQPGLSIEEAFKRVRVSVNKATDGRQTPWESSSLTDEFRFFGSGDAGAKQPAAAKRSVEDWKRDLQGKPPEAANEMIVADGSAEAYEAFVAVYTQPPFAPQARLWLDRHRRMAAWNNAVLVNNAAGYRAFLVQYPDSDLTATARKLEERMRNRPIDANAAIPVIPPTNVALAAPTCPCGAPSAPPLLKKVDLPPNKKRIDADPPKRVVSKPPRRMREPPPEDDVVVVRRAPPPDYEPAAPIIGGFIGGGFGGGYGGGGFSRGGGGGNYGGAMTGSGRGH